MATGLWGASDQANPSNRIIGICILAASALFLQACGTSQTSHQQIAQSPTSHASANDAVNGAVNRALSTPQHLPGYDVVGTASWYGRRFHGRRTASGEIYNMNAMTAAHRSLPFGTRVVVTNLENGRSVTLKINDRGPFIKGRVIDVSKHAAHHLGFVHDGLTRVGIRIVPPTDG